MKKVFNFWMTPLDQSVWDDLAQAIGEPYEIHRISPLCDLSKPVAFQMKMIIESAVEKFGTPDYLILPQVVHSAVAVARYFRDVPIIRLNIYIPDDARGGNGFIIRFSGIEDMSDVIE